MSVALWLVQFPCVWRWRTKHPGKDADPSWLIFLATIISRDHWNVRQPLILHGQSHKPTKKPRILRYTACCQVPPQRDKELMLQAGNEIGYLCPIQITSWRNGIKSSFLLNSRHTNRIHRTENSPGFWTLPLLCEDPHVKYDTSWFSISLREQKSEPANSKSHSTKFIGIIY